MDPWGNVADVAYDDRTTCWSPQTTRRRSVTSPPRNVNYRVLAPWLVTDPNVNRSGVRFDALGMVVATAAMGKLLPDGTDEGDHLDTTTAEPSASDDPTTSSTTT